MNFILPQVVASTRVQAKQQTEKTHKLNQKNHKQTEEKQREKRVNNTLNAIGEIMKHNLSIKWKAANTRLVQI